MRPASIGRRLTPDSILMNRPYLSSYPDLRRAAEKAAKRPPLPDEIKNRPLHEIAAWIKGELAVEPVPKVKVAVSTVTPAPQAPTSWSAATELSALQAELDRSPTAERVAEICQRWVDLQYGAGPLPPGFKTITQRRADLEAELETCTENNRRFVLALELAAL